MGQKLRVLMFDANRCVGCHACETACKMENDVPAGPKWIEVVQKEVAVEDNRWIVKYIPANCRHCAEPSCERACPEKAIYRTKNGLVLVDEEKCIGCGICLEACPFGAPQFGGDQKMQKCTMCAQRISLGLPTACEHLCPTGAIRSGTPRDISQGKRAKSVIIATRDEKD